MKVYVFKSESQANSYGFTEDSGGVNLPSETGPWKLFKEIYVQQGEQPRVGVSGQDILSGISKKGYYIAGSAADFPNDQGPGDA